MDIGALKTQVSLQKPPTGQDTEGQPSGAWTVVTTLFAAIKYPSGMGALKAGADLSIAKVSIRIRWRADVLPGWRMVLGSTNYKIEAVLPDMGRRYCDLVCTVVS